MKINNGLYMSIYLYSKVIPLRTVAGTPRPAAAAVAGFPCLEPLSWRRRVLGDPKIQQQSAAGVMAPAERSLVFFADLNI